MKNANNRILIVALGALILVFATIRIFRSPTMERNLPENLTSIDSSKVTELIISPARERTREVRLVRKGKTWTLQSGDRSGRIEQGSYSTALQSLMSLRPQRIISRKKEKWNEFNVGDSAGTHVKVMADNSVAADVWIGRTSFSQGPGGTFGGSSTYVRLNGEDEVYAVDGFLESQFNRGFNDWRDKSFTRIKADSITKITFQYPADSSFMIERKDRRWFTANELADSSAVVSYLSSFSFKNISEFSETEPSGPALFVLNFEKNSMTSTKIEAWQLSSEDWILRSSFQPEVFFKTSDSIIKKEILKGKSSFEKKK